MTSSSCSIPEVPLGSSGKSIPVVGFGTAAESLFASLADSSEQKAILDAIRIGYRHFDSAAVYQSEQPLGQAIKEALALGLINSRDQLFITTKLWCTDAHHDHVLPALRKSLKTLELEYVDLYLVHWPVSVKPGKHEYPVNKDVVPIDIKSVWEAMEECQKLGLAKSIGVSNFSSKKLEALLTRAKVPPSVNQVEMNPAWQQKKLREFCKEKGILVTAYSPLGAKGTAWGTNSVMDNELLKQIANEKGKTVAQVSIRWLYEQGVSFVVKSFNKERMKENLDIFGWNLSPEDSLKISQIPQRKVNLGQEFISEDGPYKCLEDLWDDEI